MRAAQKRTAQERAEVVLRAIRDVQRAAGSGALIVDGDCVANLTATATSSMAPATAALTRTAWSAHASPAVGILQSASTGASPAWCGAIPNPSGSATQKLAPAYTLDRYQVYVYVYCGLLDSTGAVVYPSGVASVDATACTAVSFGSTVQLPRRVRIVVEPINGGPGGNGLATIETVFDTIAFVNADDAPAARRSAA